MPGFALLLVIVLVADDAQPAVRVGSKVFTESVLLGEIARDLIQEAGVSGSSPTRAGGNTGSLPCPRGRPARYLSRVHRNDFGRDPGGEKDSGRSRAPRGSGRAWSRYEPAAWF